MRVKRQKNIDLINPVSIALLFALALALGFSPLLGTPGPESAFIFGVVGAPLLFFGSIRRGAQLRDRGFEGDLWLQVLVLGVGTALFSLVIWIRGMSSHACVGDRSLGYLLFTTLHMLFLNIVLGLHLGRLAKSKWFGYTLGGLFWFIWGVYTFSEWYSAPTFRFTSQLVGVLAGDLFKGLRTPVALYGFKAATLGYALVLMGLGLAFYPKTNRSSLSSISHRQTRFAWWLAPMFLLSLWGDIHNSEKLAPSRENMEREYNLVKSHNGIHVHANPNRLSADQVEATLAEANLWQDRIQSRLGLSEQLKLHIWLHASDRDRGYWTGAYHVDFALPWRGELHIADVEMPHSSLGHELVHVMASEMNDSLFNVPGRMGVLVNSGVTEGLAMAVTPELTVKEGLTLQEQAAAMLQAGYSLDMKQLMSVTGFWQQSPARAYTLSGAFIEWLLQRKAVAKDLEGLELVKSLYEHNDLSQITSDKTLLTSLLEAFHEELMTKKLPPYALGFAKKRFSRSSILKETCDPDKEEVVRQVKAALSAGDLENATTLAQAFEPTLSHETHFLFAKELARHKEWVHALKAAMTSTELLPNDATYEIGMRWLYAGDLAWLADDKAHAHILWLRASKVPLPDAWQRLIKAKLFLSEHLQANAGHGSLAKAALQYLVMVKEGKGDPVLALTQIERALHRSELQAANSPKVAAFVRYLIARQFVQRGAPDEAVMMMLALAEEDKSRLDDIFYDEVLKGLAESHLRRGDFNVGKNGYLMLLKQEKRPGLRLLYKDKIQRAQRAASDPSNRWLLGLD